MTDLWDVEEPAAKAAGAEPACPKLWNSRYADSYSNLFGKFEFRFYFFAGNLSRSRRSSPTRST